MCDSINTNTAGYACKKVGDMRFVLKGFEGDTVGRANSFSPLEIKGNWSTQGRQPVGGEGGAPEWVLQLFEQNQSITQIAINTDDNGVVYSR